jgi:hypothetical protein
MTLTPSSRLRAAPVLIALALPACRLVETPEVAEARAKRALYEKQVAGLEAELLGIREKGLSRERILIGVNEAVFREVVSATLPREIVFGEQLNLRLEKAEAYFRYTQGVIAFEGRVASTARPSLFVAVRLAGGIDNVSFTAGRLSAHVKIYYFELLGSALGDLGKAVVEGLVRSHLDLVTEALPAIEIPVRVDQGVTIDGLGEGPVSVKPGTLPFSASVARILSLDGRLWIALELRAGPWTAGTADEAASAGTAPEEKASASPPVATPRPTVKPSPTAKPAPGTKP